MSWRISIYFIFIFYYSCNGQNVLVPIKEQLANMASKQKLNLNRGTEGNTSSIKALKAKMPYGDTQMPSQWAQEPEAPYHWPSGAVKYYIDGESYDEGVADLLQMAFNLIINKDAGEGFCPYFEKLRKPGDADGDWLHFTNPDRVRPCVHVPGFSRGGEIKIVLGYDCLKPREVLHTVLHGLGFRDEITHPKRDLFVRIMWENIQPAFRSMFRIQSVGAVNSLAEYDPMSIMHFHDRAYSINGQATVMPGLPGLKIEPTDGLSHLDKMKIRRIFGHECKKLQIGRILNSCGFPEFISITDNNDVLCGKRNRSRIPSDDEIVKPGNNVETVESKGESEGQKTELEGEIEGGTEDTLVIPGNDVEPEGEDPKNKKNMLAANTYKGNAHSSDEAITVGYDTENKKDMTSNSIGEKKAKNKQFPHKLSAKGSAGSIMPDKEAIIVGYNAESGENKLRRRRRQ